MSRCKAAEFREKACPHAISDVGTRKIGYRRNQFKECFESVTESLGKIGDDVIDVLGADGEANGVRLDACSASSSSLSCECVVEAGG